MSEVLPMGESFPPDAPPFYGAMSAKELPSIPDEGARTLAEYMVSLCMRLQQRSISLALPGDIVPLQAPVDPDVVHHVIGESFGMNPEAITFLNIKDAGKLTLPEAILADPQAMDALRRFTNGNGERVIISPFAVDPGIRKLAEELRCGYGQEWPHLPEPIVPDGSNGPWKYPEPAADWQLWKANSKVEGYRISQAIDPDWLPKGEIAPSPEEAARVVARMLTTNGIDEVGVKADINVDGMGNLRFRLDKGNGKQRLIITYQDQVVEIPDWQIAIPLENGNVPDPDRIAPIVAEYCRKNAIYISKRHPAVVEKWERFFAGVSPSVEIYIPPIESGKEPFIINECAQLIQDGGYVGSINPDPLTVSLERLGELPAAYWRNLGIDPREFTHKYRAEYLKAWDQQRRLSLAFGKYMQQKGEVGHRDFDFGIVVNDDGTMSPKLCESNARRTGTWVADTVGRRLWGPTYMDQGFVITVDNLQGSVFDREFRTAHGMFAQAKGLFVPDTQTGIILTGHIRNGGKSRLLTTIVGPTMKEVWKGYQLTQDVLKWE